VSTTLRAVFDAFDALDSASLDRLHARVGDLPEVTEFYRRYGAARLFCDRITDPHVDLLASAYWIAPPSEWEMLTEQLTPWLEGLSDDERAELVPAWVDEAPVIGEIPNSGNYLLLPLSGPERGKIYEFAHDGFEFIDRGANLAAFLNRRSRVDATICREISCYTRYSDGESTWHCVAYHYDP
jgi:hypothetical protein